MKRWITLLGRGGTILIAISLALLLVSLIPSARTAPIVDTTEVAPDTFTPLRSLPIPFESFFERRLTPQQELEMEFTTNGTVTAYVLEVTAQSILNWISLQQRILARDFNLTRLEEFLAAHPDSIGWESEIHDEEILLRRWYRGATIMDAEGNRVGLWYSEHDWTVIKSLEDNVIVIYSPPKLIKDKGATREVKP